MDLKRKLADHIDKVNSNLSYKNLKFDDDQNAQNVLIFLIINYTIHRGLGEWQQKTII